jgi:tRNA pseudouridine55 synthase
LNQLNKKTLTKELLIAGMALAIDKPKTWTSFDVVNYFKKMTKVKVGHAGTLDPLATGLLILCTGPLTKQIDKYQGMNKEYIGEFVIGATTPSFDLEKEVSEFQKLDTLTKDMINEVFVTFIGEQEQTPPIFSAKKLNGERAYQMARDGQEPEMRKVTVVINKLEQTSFEHTDGLWRVGFVLNCSKGTYVRSLARDVAKKLNSVAYLDNLRRTKIGEIDLQQAYSIDELREIIPNLV